MRQDRLLEIVGRIYQRPETWNQDVWHCGTKHCVAGHAQNDMHGHICDYQTAYRDGCEWLELTESEADWLFYGDPSLEDLIRAAITGGVRMTKDEIVRVLRQACGHGGMVTEQLRYVTDTVAALDVCTAAERELVESHMRWFLAMTDEDRESALLDRQRATNDVDSERTPPDPLEAFVAEVREAIALWNNEDDPHGAITLVCRAESKLDAARSKK